MIVYINKDQIIRDILNNIYSSMDKLNVLGITSRFIHYKDNIESEEENVKEKFTKGEKDE